MSSNCCCGGGGHTPPSGSNCDPSNPEGPDTPPRVPPPCATARVQILSLQVINSDAAPFLTENWRVSVTVNGRTRSETVNVRDGSTPSLSIDPFEAELPSSDSTISVRVSGSVPDLGLSSRDLPEAVERIGEADTWGIGTTRTLHAFDELRDYTLTYAVDCQRELVQSLFSRDQAIKLVRELHASHQRRDKLSDDVALTHFINAMNARGYRLKDASSELLVWEGMRPIHRAVDNHFGITKPKPDKKVSG